MLRRSVHDISITRTWRAYLRSSDGHGLIVAPDINVRHIVRAVMENASEESTTSAPARPKARRRARRGAGPRAGDPGGRGARDAGRAAGPSAGTGAARVAGTASRRASARAARRAAVAAARLVERPPRLREAVWSVRRSLGPLEGAVLDGRDTVGLRCETDARRRRARPGRRRARRARSRCAAAAARRRPGWTPTHGCSTARAEHECRVAAARVQLTPGRLQPGSPRRNVRIGHWKR